MTSVLRLDDRVYITRPTARNRVPGVIVAFVDNKVRVRETGGSVQTVPYSCLTRRA